MISYWTNTTKVLDKNLNLHLRKAYQEDYDYFDKKIDEYTNKVLLIKKIYTNLPCGGYGILITKEEFLKQFR